MECSVFICEDNSKWRENLKCMVSDYIALTDYPIEVALVTANPLEILEAVMNNPSQNSLYILDVDLKNEVNGIMLAKKIREWDAFGKIIFVTTHVELSYLTFRHKVEAMDYIIKDEYKNIQRQINDCLEITYRFFLNGVQEKEHFQIKSATGIANIPVEDILYFESHHLSHKLILHTFKKRYEFRGIMRDVLEKSSSFSQCHKAYIINRQNVISIKRTGGTGEIEMKNGAILPVSRSRLVALKHQIEEEMKGKQEGLIENRNLIKI